VASNRYRHNRLNLKSEFRRAMICWHAARKLADPTVTKRAKSVETTWQANSEEILGLFRSLHPVPHFLFAAAQRADEVPASASSSLGNAILITTEFVSHWSDRIHRAVVDSSLPAKNHTAEVQLTHPSRVDHDRQQVNLAEITRHRRFHLRISTTLCRPCPLKA
jgi:hypothetical protein